MPTQNQKQGGYRGRAGPLLSLMMLFADIDAVAELFRKIRWTEGLACPHCKGDAIIGHGKYKEVFQRYKCKGCGKTFNDKTGTIVH